jgi:hypothetical protein
MSTMKTLSHIHLSFDNCSSGLSFVIKPSISDCKRKNNLSGLHPLTHHLNYSITDSIAIPYCNFFKKITEMAVYPITT